MTLFLGEAVTVLALAQDPARSNETIDDATATLELFNPAKDPKNVPADRTPDFTVSMTYDALATITVGGVEYVGAYRGLTATTAVGWVAGKWSYRVKLTGSYDSWEYGQFTLKE